MAAHRVPYVASVSLAHLDDAMRKLRYAIKARGFRFLHFPATSRRVTTFRLHSSDA